MNDTPTTPCDEQQLNRLLDGELTPPEKHQLKQHLLRCPACRRHVRGLMAFSETFRRRVEREATMVDFAALEKEVVTTALKRYRQRERGGLLKSLKIAVPALVTAGVLLFFAYTRFMVEPTTLPSAIINSFTGSASSVMIFETPETRQTILWYTETTDADNDNDAV
jgi:anti-sigma factor RsiW